MKALFYTGAMQAELRDTPDPTAQEGEVLVDVSHCGICGSDMHAWHGKDARRVPPLVLGHEAVGIARSGRLEGKRVAINPLMTCDVCDYCRSGREHLCLERELIGMRKPGAFAQAVAIKETNLFEIPEHLPFETAALVEPLAVCIHAANIALASQQIQSILIIGGGAIGLLMALVLQIREVPEIYLAETNAERAKCVDEVTLAQTFNPQESDAPEVSIVIDCVGSGKTRQLASQCVLPGGLVLQVGLQDNDAGFDTRRLTLQEITFIGTYCYTHGEFEEALSMLAGEQITGEGWTEIRSLEAGAQSFQDIHDANALPKLILKI